MYTLFLDETNSQYTKINNFFIYGGIFFPLDIAHLLHKKIIEIREKAGFKPNDLFKFETHSRPSSVSETAFAQAKDNLINTCIENRVLFIVYIVHHKIALRHSLQKRIEWASDEIINEFDCFLKTQKDYGTVVFDRLPFKGEFQHIVKIFNSGITTATLNNAPHIPTNIVGYFISAAGASHFASATDIILGAFRYCVNIAGNSMVAKKMFPNVLKLMYGYIDSKGNKNVSDLGLLIRPYNNLAYQKEYKELTDKLNSFLK